MRLIIRVLRAIVFLIGTMFVLGFSLLPLASLLLALPLVSPNEAVLADTVPPAKSWLRRMFRRLLGLGAGIVVLVALLAFSIEIVNRALPVVPKTEKHGLQALAERVLGFAMVDLIYEPLPPPEEGTGRTPLTPRELIDKRDELQKSIISGTDSIRIREAEAQLQEIEAEIEQRTPTSRKLRVMLNPELAPWLAVPIYTLLPTALVQHWPFVFLVMYGTDLLLLMLIGKVPLNYNIRNLMVRWRINVLTGFAFFFVVALLIILLAFVNGMYRLNQGTGIKGNVFILSDGATDELFSNLGYGDVDNVARVTVDIDEKGNALPGSIRVRRAVPTPDGRLSVLQAGQEPPAGQQPVFLASKEIYFVVNQPIPTKEGEQPRRRFNQMRAIQDPLIAAEVHNIQLYEGGQWFSPAGVQQGADGKSYIQVVLGEGAASILGQDAGKPYLEIGDTFNMGDLNWIVVGIMKAEGTTFGSEIWTQNIDLVTRTFGKKGNYTSMVVRVEPETLEAARAFGYHLQNRYTVQKLKAFAEVDYYAELTKTNEQFLTYIVAVAVIMAIGGVFGVMNTMFASIAARIKEVGVLRILGFKRWQILISFMLEALAIAFFGGLLGVLFGSMADGFESRSTLSGGQGGGKNVALRMTVDAHTIAAGLLFTLMMGRLGGLVPALSAMRMKILDSLK